MNDNERLTLEAAPERLREVHGDIEDAPAGVALLHLEATIAALESRLRRSDAPLDARGCFSWARRR